MRVPTSIATTRGIIRGMDAHEKEQAAREQLTKLAADYHKTEERFEAARKALNEGIVEVLKARTLGPSEVTRIVPYERQHVGRISKAAGIPPLRERTVVSAKQAAATPRPQAVQAAPRRQEPRPERPGPAPRRPMADAEAKELADLARSRADSLQLKRLEQTADQVSEAYKDFAVVSEAMSMSLLTDDDRADAAEES